MAAITMKQQDVILDEDSLKKAIAGIDDVIDKNGLELMKLSMYDELTQDEKDKAKSPSDLARYLKRHYGNPQDLLERFIYTLRILGRRHYGHCAVRKLEKSFVSSKCHPYNNIAPMIDRQKFLLCQYLVTACRLIPLDCCKSFIRLCAKKLGHNPNNYKTPCRALIKLLQLNMLTYDNHVDIMEDLFIKAGVSESIMEEYENMCIKIENGDLSSRSTSRSRSASISTLKRHKSSGDVRISAMMATHHMPYSGSNRFTMSLPRRFPGYEREESEQLPQSHTLGPEKGKKMKISYTDYCYCTFCSSFFIAAFLLLVCVLAICFFDQYEWRAPMIVRCEENTSVILAEVHHLITDSVIVTEDTKHIGDFYRDVEIYHMNLPCNSLPTRDKVTTITSLSFSNGTTFYAIADSSIHFSICGKTNHTFGELERLELILIKDTPQATVVDAIDFFHVGMSDEQECKESTLYLNEPGYYTVTFLPPTHPAEFTLNANYSIYEIGSEQLYKRAKANYTLHMDQDGYAFPLDFTSRVVHSCFVAVIGDNLSTLKENVHIKLKFRNQRKIFFIPGSILIAGTIIYFVTLIIEFLCMRAYIIRCNN